MSTRWAASRRPCGRKRSGKSCFRIERNKNKRAVGRNMQKRYFTLEEAQQIIPAVDPILKRLVRLYQDLVSNTRMSKRFHKLSFDFYRLFEKILDMGIIVKDLNKGLIDFYSACDGREIFLCYEMDEKDIKYWHELFDGYEERKPVSLLKKRIKNDS